MVPHVKGQLNIFLKLLKSHLRFVWLPAVPPLVLSLVILFLISMLSLIILIQYHESFIQALLVTSQISYFNSYLHFSGDNKVRIAKG